MTDSEREDAEVIALPVTVISGDETTNPAMQFVREHPVLVLAGGIAVGALAAALIPRQSRTAIGRRASALAEAASAAGLALGRQALERAGSTGAELKRQGARAADRVETMSEAALAHASRLGGATAERVEHFVAPATRAAAEAGNKVTVKAADLVARARAGRAKV